MFAAEIRKLKRSATWVIALLLPLVAVTTGTINVAANAAVLDSGWGSLTSQVTLFYGLLFFSLGIGLLAATVWRTEHHGTNGNFLLTTTRRPSRLVLAKIAAIAVPVAIMQLVLVAAIAASGTFVLGLRQHALAVRGGRRARPRRGHAPHRPPVAALDDDEIARRTGRALPSRVRCRHGGRHF
ncbi:MAG: ABC transporter permease [Propioniciclava sp.]